MIYPITRELNFLFKGTGLYGTGGVFLAPKQLHLSIELGNPALKVWQKYRLQIGFSMSNQLHTKMGLNKWLRDDQDRVIIKKYWINQRLRYGGVNIGLRRNFSFAKKRFNFLIGLEAEARYALKHYFLQEIKISTFSSNLIDNTTHEVPTIKGKRFTQTHIMLPLGLEYTYKSFAVRFEVFAGLVNDRYKQDIVDKEAHGLTFWLGYKL